MSATQRGSREEGLAAALAPSLTPLGVDLEGVSITTAGRRELVRVTVDRDGGVDLDTIADVSRVVSEALDDPALASVLPGPFVLEVSSPGVDRPLTQVRHWRRASGRLVLIHLADGESFTGRVTAVTDDGDVTVAVDGQSRTFGIASVRKAVVQVEFESVPEVGDTTTDEAGR